MVLTGNDSEVELPLEQEDQSQEIRERNQGGA
jgi:hypothetical protein